MNYTRIDKSRKRLVKAFYYALGSYTEQEAKKEDSWRDLNIGQLYGHLAHEIEEIGKNLKRQEGGYFVHNCTDAVSLSLILLARAMEMAGLFEEEK